MNGDRIEEYMLSTDSTVRSVVMERMRSLVWRISSISSITWSADTGGWSPLMCTSSEIIVCRSMDCLSSSSSCGS